jgi:hypothetical protein
MLEPLVLAAQALIILDGAEDLGAKKAVALRLEGPVVDGFRLFDLAKGPRPDLVRRGYANPDRIEFFLLIVLLEELE